MHSQLALVAGLAAGAFAAPAHSPPMKIVSMIGDGQLQVAKYEYAGESEQQYVSLSVTIFM